MMPSSSGGVWASTTRVACWIIRRALRVHLTHRLGALVATLTLSLAALLVLTQARPVRSQGRGGWCVRSARTAAGPSASAWLRRGFPLWLATAHTAGAALLLLAVLNLLRALGLTASGRPI